MIFLEWSLLEAHLIDAGSGRILWRQTVAAGDSIDLHYVHSVERTAVVETFKVRRDGLMFMEMRFASQGAGLPTEGYVREGDAFVLRRPRYLGTVTVRLSAVNRHRLRIGRQDVDLVAIAGDGAAVTLGIGRAAQRLRWRSPRQGL